MSDRGLVRLSPVLLLLGACDLQPIPKDNPSDDTDAPDCRAGLYSASTEDFSFIEFSVDGLGDLPSPTALCVSSDGLQLVLDLTSSSGAGSIDLAITEAGLWGVPSDQLLNLQVSDGALVWASQDFYAGSVGVQVEGRRAEGALEVEAQNTDGQLTLNLVWGVDLP